MISVVLVYRDSLLFLNALGWISTFIPGLVNQIGIIKLIIKYLYSILINIYNLLCSIGRGGLMGYR